MPGGRLPAHGGTGALHLAFAIGAADLEDWKERLRAHEIPLESTVTWDRGGTSLYFRDPDGHCIELVTPGCWSIY